MDKLTEVKEFIGQKLERIEFQEITNNPIFVFESGAIYVTDFLKLKKMLYPLDEKECATRILPLDIFNLDKKK